MRRDKAAPALVLVATLATIACGCESGSSFPAPSVEWSIAEESPTPGYEGATILDRSRESVDHLNVPRNADVFIGALTALGSNAQLDHERVGSSSAFSVLSDVRSELVGQTVHVTVLGGTADGRTSNGVARFDKQLLSSGGAFLVIAVPVEALPTSLEAWQVFAITPAGLVPVHRRNEYPLPPAPDPLAFDDVNQGLMDAEVVSEPIDFDPWAG